MDETPSSERDVRSNESYESFVRLFVRDEPGIRAFIRPLVQTREDVDEVLQQTCLVLWRKYSELRQGSSFLSWALTVARFEVLKFRRSKARDRLQFGEELVLLLAEECQQESTRRALERAALEQCLEKLAPAQRDLIQRSYCAGSSIRDAAESLGRTATGLYKALNRIRRVLLECIERTLAQEPLT